MFTHNDYKNQFNILISLDKDKHHVFVKITDKLNYGVYTSTVDTLGLQSLMVCQNHQQLYNILVKSFTTPSNVTINITNTCMMIIHCQISPDYHLDFSITLDEQPETTEKMNQTLLLETTKQYDDKIKSLHDKINKLESTLSENKKILDYQIELLQKSTVFIGVCQPKNFGTYLPMTIPFGKQNLKIVPGVYDSEIYSYVNQMNQHILSTISLINVEWKTIASLPLLNTLDIKFNMYSNENEFSLKDIANNSITNLTLRQYPHATMEGLEKFESLKELSVESSSALKSLHQYLPNNIKTVQITACQSLIEAEKPSLESMCNKRKIQLKICKR